ncbi:hypothetical protein JX265_007176 [Neoarthrinium moseri]|uniref:Heterokaryon incompatibility domain-containing protein n=1 Tax=Neoarthrinium moseri TaxID=1658444 RepID=A0A9P9WKS8_9PEZI|nr:hypothetical protein JX265_007176 [Neoarthrinium moseri]
MSALPSDADEQIAEGLTHTSHAVPLYQYEPLEKNCIRVVDLQPAQTSVEQLRCRFVNVDLDKDDIPYECISYTWGAPDFDHAVSIISKETPCNIRITENLADALRRFRLTDRPRRLWADAICINQEDDGEKSTQIPLMGNIFHGALGVLVWLGSSHAEQLARLRSLSRRTITRVESLSMRDMGSVTDSFEKLLALPWFTRRWVIQEVVLNPNVFFFCGTVELPWIAFHSCLVKTTFPESTALRILRAVRSMKTMFELWKGCALPRSEPQAVASSIGRILHIFDAYECADGRDRLYSVAALASNVNVHLSGTTSASSKQDLRGDALSISVNYSRSLEEVYIDFAEEAVGKGHLFWLLCMVSSRKQMDHSKPRAGGLPSWVPDWRIGRTHPYREMPLVSSSSVQYEHTLSAHRIEVPINMWLPDEDSPNHAKRELPRIQWRSTCFPANKPVLEMIAWFRDIARTLCQYVIEGIPPPIGDSIYMRRAMYLSKEALEKLFDSVQPFSELDIRSFLRGIKPSNVIDMKHQPANIPNPTPTDQRELPSFMSAYNAEDLDHISEIMSGPAADLCLFISEPLVVPSPGKPGPRLIGIGPNTLEVADSVVWLSAVNPNVGMKTPQDTLFVFRDAAVRSDVPDRPALRFVDSASGFGFHWDPQEKLTDPSAVNFEYAQAGASKRTERCQFTFLVR